MGILYIVYVMFCVGFGAMFAHDGKSATQTISYFFIGCILCPLIVGGMTYEYLHKVIRG